jgi:enoyl-CoA hydratase/carnithine racemase
MHGARHIVLDRRGDVAWITIDRAEKANALTAAMMQALANQLADAAHEEAIKAIVLIGAGRRAFSGGVDVRTVTDLAPDEARELRSERFFALLFALAEIPKPVIVGVNGVACGAGAMLALLGDRLIATQDAALALPEIDLADPTYAGIAILAHVGGGALAADLVQTGRRMSASEAHARGLYAEVVKDEELEGRVEQAALLLGSKPASAFALNKRWLRRSLVAALRQAEEDTRSLRASRPRAGL